MLIKVVDRADESISGKVRIVFIVPEAAKAWRGRGLSGSLQT
jgi:hypothetical protein